VDLTHVAAALQGRLPQQIVELAYLELAEPDIPTGLETCAERGATSIRILPYFLSAGAHVTDDLERFRRQFSDTHVDIRCHLCPPLGLHPLMIDILVDRLNEIAPDNT